MIEGVDCSEYVKHSLGMCGKTSPKSSKMQSWPTTGSKVEDDSANANPDASAALPASSSNFGPRTPSLRRTLQRMLPRATTRRGAIREPPSPGVGACDLFRT